MRAGIPFSLALHLAALAAGVTVAPALSARPESMMVLPVELLVIDEETSVIPVIADEPDRTPDAEAPDEAVADPSEEDSVVIPDEPEPAPEPAASAPSAPAPAPEPAPEAIVPAPKEEAAKPEPPPKPKAEAGFDLNSVLRTVEQKKSERPPPQRTSTDIRKVDDAAAPRRGAGDEQRMTITVADFIKTQLVQRGCWRGAADMPDADRLQATIRVRFSRDGTFAAAPELRAPARIPTGDPPLQTFIQRAFRALNRCEPFDVPPEYFPSAPWIDILFVPET